MFYMYITFYVLPHTSCYLIIVQCYLYLLYNINVKFTTVHNNCVAFKLCSQMRVKNNTPPPPTLLVVKVEDYFMKHGYFFVVIDLLLLLYKCDIGYIA